MRRRTRRLVSLVVIVALVGLGLSLTTARPDQVHTLTRLAGVSATEGHATFVGIDNKQSAPRLSPLAGSLQAVLLLAAGWMVAAQLVGGGPVVGPDARRRWRARLLGAPGRH